MSSSPTGSFDTAFASTIYTLKKERGAGKTIHSEMSAF